MHIQYIPLKRKGDNTASSVYDGPQEYLEKLFRDPFSERISYSFQSNIETGSNRKM